MAVLTPEQVPGSQQPPSNPLSGDGWNGGTPSSPSGPLPPKPGRRIAKKWWWVAGAGIIAVIAVAASAAGQKPASTANNQPAGGAAATAAPTPPPTAPTLVRSGSGDGVVTVPTPYDTGAGLLTATHNGETQRQSSGNYNDYSTLYANGQSGYYVSGYLYPGQSTTLQIVTSNCYYAYGQYSTFIFGGNTNVGALAPQASILNCY